jgi:hypothetical protein
MCFELRLLQWSDGNIKNISGVRRPLWESNWVLSQMQANVQTTVALNRLNVPSASDNNTDCLESFLLLLSWVWSDGALRHLDQTISCVFYVTAERTRTGSRKCEAGRRRNGKRTAEWTQTLWNTNAVLNICQVKYFTFTRYFQGRDSNTAGAEVVVFMSLSWCRNLFDFTRR